MPGFVTHYIFGKETYGKITSNSLKKNIRANHAAYSFGQQGPDLFFYCLPFYVLHKPNISALAHNRETGAFFQGMLKSCLRLPAGTDRAIAEAYLAGFLGHYTLDTICHPYIYAMTHYNNEEKKDYFYHHAYLETDIDTALLYLKLHRRPCQFHAADTIALTHRQKKIIAALLHDAYAAAFPKLCLHKSSIRFGICSMRLCLRLLRDPTGQKKVLFRFLEKYLLGYPLVSPLIPSDALFFRADPFHLRRTGWRNPWDKTLVSEETFFELYEKSGALYRKRLKKLDAILQCDTDRSRQKRLVREFLADYGNLSLHSGLDASV